MSKMIRVDDAIEGTTRHLQRHISKSQRWLDTMEADTGDKENAEKVRAVFDEIEDFLDDVYNVHVIGGGE